MKSILKKTALIATLVALSTEIIAPRPAHAIIALAGNPFNPRDTITAIAQAIVCIALLPLCLLDEKVEGVPAVTTQDLADNGYSSAEIQDITSDYARLQAEATERNLRLEVAPADTRESLAKDIRSIIPEASDTFVEFYTRQAVAR